MAPRLPLAFKPPFNFRLRRVIAYPGSHQPSSMRANLVASLALLAQAAEGIVAIAASPIPTHDDNLPAQLHTPDTEIRRDLIPSPPTKRHGRCRNGNRRTMDGEPAGSTGSTAMPAPETPLKSSQGLRNVVYFTNWYVLATPCSVNGSLPPPGAFMGPITSHSRCRRIKSLISYMRLRP